MPFWSCQRSRRWHNLIYKYYYASLKVNDILGEMKSPFPDSCKMLEPKYSSQMDMGWILSHVDWNWHWIKLVLISWTCEKWGAHLNGVTSVCSFNSLFTFFLNSSVLFCWATTYLWQEKFTCTYLLSFSGSPHKVSLGVPLTCHWCTCHWPFCGLGRMPNLTDLWHQPRWLPPISWLMVSLLLY